MKQQDWDFIESLKTKGTIDVETLNKIKKIALAKRNEFLKSSEFLLRFKKVNFIYDIFLDKEFDYKNWKTLLAYWTFKRLGENLGTTFSLDNNEPNVSEYLIERFDNVFLRRVDSEIVGVSCELDKLIIINSDGSACFEEFLMYHPIADFISCDFLSIVNKVLDILGVDQRINICEGNIKNDENVIKAFYSASSNPENSVYINIFSPLLNNDDREKCFRIFISFQNQMPRVANVYYHLENGQYHLKVEEVHNISGLLSVKNQDNPELIRQRLMHELFKTNY